MADARELLRDAHIKRLHATLAAARAEADVLRAVLRELIECKALHDEAETIRGGITKRMLGKGELARLRAIEPEYRRRKPVAWQNARLVLAAPAAVGPEAPRSAIIERAKDDHAMHEFYCGMLRQLMLAARSYRTVFPPSIDNRTSMDAADTLDERLREVDAFLSAGDAAPAEAPRCQHEWETGNNVKVGPVTVCVKCGAIRGLDAAPAEAPPIRCQHDNWKDQCIRCAAPAEAPLADEAARLRAWIGTPAATITITQGNETRSLERDCADAAARIESDAKRIRELEARYSSALEDGLRKSKMYNELQENLAASRERERQCQEERNLFRSALLELEQAYSNKHSPQHRGAALCRAVCVLAASQDSAAEQEDANG